MKRIAIYMPSFAGGGAERNAVLIANQFKRLGHDVNLIADKASGPNHELVRKGISIYELGNSTHIADVIALRKIIKRISPDIVFARLGLSPIKIILAITGVLSFNSIIISYHNVFNPSSRPGGQLKYYLASILTRIVGGTIAVSSDIKEELVQRFHACRDRITVVHNPVDLKWIEMNARDHLPACIEKRSYILAVGRFVDQKDFPTLIQAFSVIKHKLDCNLVILGDGPQRLKIEKLVTDLDLTDRVFLPGYLPNPFPVYKNASLFVLSSIFEGFGNVIVEALALGVPVVATRCPGGPKDILEEGRYGRLVPMSDSKTMAEAILAELSNPVPSATLKTRARDFHVDRVAEIYLSIAGA